MDYITSGNSYVDQGTNLIALGAFLTSLGWYLLATHKQRAERRFEKRWLFKDAITIIMFLIISVLIICGLRMVGKGGTLTTKGWNIISLGEQRNNLIQAVTQELVMNCGRLGSPPMKGEVHYKEQDGKLIRYRFSTFRSVALNAVLSSGLWDYGNQTDRKFLNAISDYERGVAYANRKFYSYEDVLSRMEDTNEAIKQSKELQSQTYEKVWFKSFQNRQKQVGNLIWSDYKWAIQTQLPEAYKLLQKIFQEESTVSKSEEGPSEKK